MHSLIEHCRAAGFSHPVHLYWGVRHPDDFYQLPHWQDWEQQAGLQLHRVVSEAAAWGGRCAKKKAAIGRLPAGREAAVPADGLIR